MRNPHELCERYQRQLARRGIVFDPYNARHEFCKKALHWLMFEEGLAPAHAAQCAAILTAASTRDLTDDIQNITRWLDRRGRAPFTPHKPGEAALPSFDAGELEKILARQPQVTLEALEQDAPRPKTRAETLCKLFLPDDLLLFSPRRDASAGELRVIKTCEVTDDGWPFMVPNPAHSVPGPLRPDGSRSPRYKENFPLEKFVVVEFDSLALEKQPHVLRNLSTPGVPLAMVVFSGNKSFHGWFDVRQASPEQARELKERAAAVGADPATLKPYQLVRAPFGVRETDDEDHQGDPITVLQTVHYLKAK